MSSNFEFIESKISEICNSIQHITYLSKNDYMEYTDTQKRELISLIENIDITVLREFKDELIDSISEYDFNICGDKNIEVCLQFQYSSEDDETVTYEYTIDGGGTTNTIEISKESIIEELNKGEEISDIILSEIECNSF